MITVNLTHQVRSDHIATFILFTEIRPLQRPRLNPHTKTIYQPKTNQQQLLIDMSRYTRLEIDFPVIIDLFINFSLSYVKNASDHPTSKSYGDEDNLRKAVMDALVYCGHLKDDRYVVGGETFKSFGSDDLAVIKIFKIHKELTNHEIFPPMLNQSSR